MTSPLGVQERSVLCSCRGGHSPVAGTGRRRAHCPAGGSGAPAGRRGQQEALERYSIVFR